MASRVPRPRRLGRDVAPERSPEPMSAPSPRIADHFARLTDPRRRKVTHPLINIITIALCGSIAGADDFVAMTKWALLHKDWLAQFLDLPNGIPSHDLLNNLFRRLNPKEFERCLLSWLAALHDVRLGRLIAIDGKTLRGSFDTATARSALHMVSAWAVSQKLSLGSVTVDQKSNEITAIPELLKLLELAGAIVTIDAMGCQTKIAEAIVAGGGDYILAVKRDKPTLYEGIEAFFLDHLNDDFTRVKVSRHETREAGHGRTEHRTYDVCDVPSDWPEAKRGPGLVRIGMAISDTVRGGKECDAVRYYILSQE